MTLVSRYALILVSIVVMAIYTPQFFEMAFSQRVKKTHILYSPVLKKFIWRDNLPELPEVPNVDYAPFIQQDEDGNTYTRRQFEELLPFIYYKNMELWGKLPLSLEGKTFDKQTIKKSRQVLEFKPDQIAGNSPEDKLLPLMESAPGIARLVFPKDRFRLGSEMEFINTESNKRDEKLTAMFTDALKAAGFRFPGRLASGKPTILKPFDEGVFLVDSQGAVFHVKRTKGQPKVIKTPIDPAAGVRSIKISENRQRRFYGLILTKDDTLSLLSYDNYKLIPLPLDGYNPDTMDFKLIINPLYRTASYSDSKQIHAVAMDKDYTPIARHKHTMPGADMTKAETMFAGLTPFTLSLGYANSGYLSLSLTPHGMPGVMIALLAASSFLFCKIRRHAFNASAITDSVIIALTGIYGFTVVLLLPEMQGRACPAPRKTGPKKHNQ